MYKRVRLIVPGVGVIGALAPRPVVVEVRSATLLSRPQHTTEEQLALRLRPGLATSSRAQAQAAPVAQARGRTGQTALLIAAKGRVAESILIANLAFILRQRHVIMVHVQETASVPIVPSVTAAQIVVAASSLPSSRSQRRLLTAAQGAHLQSRAAPATPSHALAVPVRPRLAGQCGRPVLT